MNGNLHCFFPALAVQVDGFGGKGFFVAIVVTGVGSAVVIPAVVVVDSPKTN